MKQFWIQKHDREQVRLFMRLGEADEPMWTTETWEAYHFQTYQNADLVRKLFPDTPKNSSLYVKPYIVEFEI